MDVSAFVSPGLGDPVSLAIFIAGVVFVTGMLTSVAVMIYRPDFHLRVSFVLSLVCIGCMAITVVVADSYASDLEAGRNAGYEDALLDSYGFTADSGPGVDEIQAAGDEGVTAQLTRGGSTYDVRLRIDDGTLIIMDADGQEIPANNRPATGA